MTSPQTPVQQQTTSTGLAPNVAGALCYVLGFITGIIFLLLEKDNKFVRFHAAQSITVTGLCIVVGIALSIISMVPLIGWIVGLLLSLVLWLGSLIVWILLMVKAYQGQEWEFPLAGAWARKIAG